MRGNARAQGRRRGPCAPIEVAPESPKRRRLIKAAAGLVLATGVVGGWAIIRRGRSLFEVRRERSMMETSVSVTCFASEVPIARSAIESAFARMAGAVTVLTRFESSSPVAQLNRTGRLSHPPAMLREVLARAREIATHTDGDFDVTVQPVLDYFLSLERPVVLTAMDRRAIAVRERLVGYRGIELDANGIRLSQPGMGITLDGIAKGYVVDQGIAALRAAGIEYGLIDAGGEIRSIAGLDTKRFWNVGIVDPQHNARIAAVVRLRNAALSTSGNYEVFFSADRRLFHIVDPHTGFSPDRYSSVTVMAERAIDTDAMSVAAFSMEMPRLREVMAARGHQWLVFSWDGSERWRSADLPLIAGGARLDRVAT